MSKEFDAYGYIPLTPYQLMMVEDKLEVFPHKENLILNKYGVYSIEELPATKFDEIMDMI